MDKDLAAAMMLERCSCYDKSLAAAKKVLDKGGTDSEDSFMARKIIRSLGEEFLKQRFMEKALECYALLTDADHGVDSCPDTDDAQAFEDMGPNNIALKTMVSEDVFELFQAVQNSGCSTASNQEELLREAVYQLILKYASDETVRKMLFNKLEKVIRKDI
ncbi:hypothetical protein SAMN02746065_10613 [Desulfocicer vacuolatum DSM 3385]|uniref:Uncharacterized protein n=1 Tax=Desulfocicer vacuolatum DSM 3385 TaxID=1121400 RepID=A0A1W2AQI5_9BACT|nr:hypothetical protein [Desulfocicer vacuolatum]SMC62864.1 hypothetical protein SAMN02746065_10613 [Desulfocicer vacuolatum DSM 3385]